MTDARVTLGWREWIALPELNISGIKAKIDTGARTSALHTYKVYSYRDENGSLRVTFALHPLQTQLDYSVECDVPVHDVRWVTDSGGHKERRYVILTDIQIADNRFSVEMTLTNRETMTFRMLIGRTALEAGFIVDPSQSFLTGTQHQLII